MYILLHGAKRNVGDFLIFERARELVKEYRHTDDFIELPRWHSLESHLDVINKSNAIILCGGPGYGSNFYPDIFPLVVDLSKIKVPIIPLGLGWGVGNIATDINTFQFSESSLDAIKQIHNKISCSSVRDVLTEQVIKGVGIDNVITAGCPAWYYLPYIDRDFEPPKDVKKVVISTPTEKHNFSHIQKLLSLIGNFFPKAEKILAFHRGILPGKYAKKREVLLNSKLAVTGFLSGYKIVDASYSTKKIEFYENCDLHIGYRVHAHIDFLSLRKPSILLQEDARGIGQSQTLQTSDVLANDLSAFETIEKLLDTYIDTRFEPFHQTIQIMRTKHRTMQQYIESF